MIYLQFMKHWWKTADFLSMVYGNIVRNWTSYVPNIPFQVAELLIKKLANNIFHHYRKSSNPVHPTIHPLWLTHQSTHITEDELEGVQYLEGYAVRKSSKKSPRGSETPNILNEMIASDYSGQELIAAQSR